VFSQSIHFIIGQKVWQGFAGLITVVLIAIYLTPVEQGWFYTFISIAALYSIFEMGISVAILQTSATFFVRLRWGRNGQVEGPEARQFWGFLNQACRIYYLIAILFFIGVLLFGVVYFSAKDANQDQFWLLPWVFMVTATSLSMLLIPYFATLEGGGQIQSVYLMRLIQGVVGAVVCWLIIIIGGSLWASMAMPLAATVIGFGWLFLRRRRLLLGPTDDKTTLPYAWSKEVWPLQWRVSLSWICIYGMSQLATPLLFYYQDAVIAGQMGLTLALVHMLGIVAQSPITRRVPSMAQAVALQDWQWFDAVFKKDLLWSIALYVFGALCLIGAYQVVQHLGYGHRLLPLNAFLGLIGFVFFFLMNHALAAQLRSFQKEPLVWVFLGGSVLILIGSVWAVQEYSAIGVVQVMLAVQSFVVFPLAWFVWRKCNQQWR
jgi:hypothetical protein